MGEDGVGKAGGALQDLVERAVAAAGVEHHVLAAHHSVPGVAGEVAGPPGDAQGEGDAPGSQGCLGVALDLHRAVTPPGGGIDEKNVSHGFFFSP